MRSQRSRGGITVRLDPDDPQSVLIRFFDADGIDIDEGTQRKIERLYYREEFRRAFAADIGDIGFPPRALEYYTAALMASVDTDAIRAGGFKVVLDYAYGSTSFVMPNVLAKLGAEVLAVNPYAATAGAAGFERAAHAEQVRKLVRAPGPTSAPSSTPTASTSRSSTTAARSSPTTRRCSPCCTSCASRASRP